VHALPLSSFGEPHGGFDDEFLGEPVRAMGRSWLVSTLIGRSRHGIIACKQFIFMSMAGQVEADQQFLAIAKLDIAREGDTLDLEPVYSSSVQAISAAYGGSESRFLNAADRGLADINGPSIGIAEVTDLKPKPLLEVLFRTANLPFQFRPIRKSRQDRVSFGVASDLHPL
jgi:hypothetical protein